jgi:GT2 family glycosyltransferase
VGDPNAVTAAYVCGNSVIYSWHKCMVELLAYDSATNERVMRGGFIATRFGADGLGEARNKTVRTFLEEDKADWLWWVDTDMGFSPDTVDRLVEAADPQERPVVGALCFFNREDKSDDLGGYRHTVVPTVYDWAHVDGQYGWQVRWDYATNTLTQVGATGAACVLVHRSVFEKIEAEHGQVWYDRVPNVTTGQLIGEDMSFCLRAGALGIPVFVHTGVPTTHFKHLWLGEEDYWTQIGLNALKERVAAETEAAAAPAEATP